MPHYRVALPEGLALLVKVTESPIDFKIHFPDGKAVHFSFTGGANPSSSVTESAGLHVTAEPASLSVPYTSTVVSSSATGGPTIKYADALDDGSRPMDP
jgi:hypothetical protein